MSVDWGKAAHEAALAHMEKVWALYYASEEGASEGELDAIGDVAFAPFDGCETCIVREVLAGAWSVIEAYVDAEAATRRQEQWKRAILS